METHAGCKGGRASRWVSEFTVTFSLISFLLTNLLFSDAWKIQIYGWSFYWRALCRKTKCGSFLHLGWTQTLFQSQMLNQKRKKIRYCSSRRRQRVKKWCWGKTSSDSNFIIFSFYSLKFKKWHLNSSQNINGSVQSRLSISSVHLKTSDSNRGDLNTNCSSEAVQELMKFTLCVCVCVCVRVSYC